MSAAATVVVPALIFSAMVAPLILGWRLLFDDTDKYKCTFCRRPFVDYGALQKHKVLCMKYAQDRLDREWAQKQERKS